MTDDLGDVLKPIRVKLLDDDELHDTKHDIALNETEDIQQQITQLWEAVISLRKDVEKLLIMAN